MADADRIPAETNRSPSPRRVGGGASFTHRMSPLYLPSLAVVLLSILVAGCSNSAPDSAAHSEPPFVKTVQIEPEPRAEVRVSGTVRARYETPIAFQVSGRILSRDVDAGQRVKSGTLLFRLDPRDLEEAERWSAAQLAGAEAALLTERKGVERRRELIASKAVSQDELERAELAERDAVSRRDAARANLAQARNARTYSQLYAKQAGVLTEVTGEPGQVVAVGQQVAVLAQDGEREVEVFLADGRRAPPTGSAVMADNTTVALALREVAGAADPVSRTWRVRYRVVDRVATLPLGTVVHVTLSGDVKEVGGLLVPLGAVDERGSGPQLWIIADGKATPVPVKMLGLEIDYARVSADLPPGTKVIALGTHLLTPGMAVRERTP
ncbi:MAG: efflux RND transporter periplasmic adaptor subunit [Nitrospiraceae bacterium]